MTATIELINKSIKQLKTLTNHIFVYSNRMIYRLEEMIKEYQQTNDNSINENETTVEKIIKQKETEFDQNYEILQRNQNIIDIEEPFNEMIKEFQEHSHNIFQMCKSKQEELTTENNYLLKTILSIDKQRVNNQIEENPSFKNILKSSYISLKESELNEFIKSTPEMIKQKEIEVEMRMNTINNWLTKEELLQLENNTQLLVDKIIFNSSIHQWDQPSLFWKGTDFDKIMKNKHDFVLLIKYHNIKFGAFIHEPIYHANMYIRDPKAFLFSFANKNMEITYIKNIMHAVKVFDDKDENLICVGDNDICLKKSNKKERSLFKNVIIGKDESTNIKQYCFEPVEFTPTAFMIIQMKHDLEIEENKLTEQKDRYEDFSSICQYTEMTQLEHWIGKEFSQILYDSTSFNGMSVNREIENKIINRSNLLFLFTTMNGIVFGCFIYQTIEKTDEFITDPNAFLFTFNKQKYQRFDIDFEKKDSAFLFYKSHQVNLFKIGYRDVIINKKPFKSSCFQNNNYSFNYRGIPNALLGTSGCDCTIINRIVIVETK